MTVLPYDMMFCRNSSHCIFLGGGEGVELNFPYLGCSYIQYYTRRSFSQFTVAVGLDYIGGAVDYLLQVSQLLLAVDAGRLHEFKGKQLEEINFEGMLHQIVWKVNV